MGRQGTGTGSEPGEGNSSFGLCTLFCWEFDFDLSFGKLQIRPPEPVSRVPQNPKPNAHGSCETEKETSNTSATHNPNTSSPQS